MVILVQDAAQGTLSKQRPGLLVLAPLSVAELPLAGAHSGEEPLVSLVFSAGGDLVLAGTALGRHHVWCKSNGKCLPSQHWLTASCKQIGAGRLEASTLML